MKAKFLIPLLLFFVLLGFLAVGLTRDPREVPSPLINRPAPDFKVSQLIQADQHFSPADLKGQVWVLNVWASWCVSCREEHEQLIAFSKRKAAPLIGLDYKDPRMDALKVLAQRGNPYDITAVDQDGRVGIDFGVYGVPETYVIDKQGIIRFKQICPVTVEVLEKTIYPLIDRLKQS